jgi:hypothetical protein
MQRNRYRYSEWLERLEELLQSFFLDISWNYLSDAQGFVPADDVEGGIPEGFYVVAGLDKYSTDAWAWLTLKSVENIVDAPVVNNPPWPVTGPTGTNEMTDESTIYLEITDNYGKVISGSGPFDPDGDIVTFEAILDTDKSDIVPVDVVISVSISSDGLFKINWTPDGNQYDLYYDIYSSDGEFTTKSEGQIYISLGVNHPPWPVTGPTGMPWLSKGDSFLLEVSDLNDPPNVYVSPGPFDPDGDPVTFEVVPVSIIPEISGFLPEATAIDGVFSMVWNPVYVGAQHEITFRITTSDGVNETLPETLISVMVY